MLEIVKSMVKKLPFALSVNHGYDLWTQKIMREYLYPNSCCIDVGCLKGEILDDMLRVASDGTHFGFEPIPAQYDRLCDKYRHHDSTHIFNYALSDRMGESTFNLVKTNLSYSGLKKRDYDRPNEVDTNIMVQIRRLDDVLPINQRIDLIKIDVEGGEMQVLLGGINTIERNRPLVIFGHGKGASEYYGTTPDMIFDYFKSMNMQISLLPDLIKGASPLSKEGFVTQFELRLNYYFIAHI